MSRGDDKYNSRKFGSMKIKAVETVGDALYEQHVQRILKLETENAKLKEDLGVALAGLGDMCDEGENGPDGYQICYFTKKGGSCAYKDICLLGKIYQGGRK